MKSVCTFPVLIIIVLVVNLSYAVFNKLNMI